MASNTQKPPKRNRIEMIGSAAANTFTNVAAIALFTNPPLAVNPANIPAPKPHTNTLELLSNHAPQFLAQNQNTPEIFHPHSSHIVLKQGDNLGNDIIIHDLKYYTIDRNGDVYFMGHSQDGKLLIGKNKELLWHEGQNVEGLVTDAIEAEGMFHGFTFDMILSGKPTNPPHAPEAVVILRNGGIVFDSRNLGGNFLGQYSHKIGTDYFYEYSVNGKTEYLKNGEETVSQLPQAPNNKPAPKPKIEPNELSQLPVRNAMGFQFNNHNTYAVFTGTDASGKWNLVVAEGGVAVAQACCPTQDKANGKAASVECEPSTSPGQCKPPVHPAYTRDVFLKGIYNPYWKMFEKAASKYKTTHPEITASLLAAIAVQESGKGDTGVPSNKTARNFTVGIMQINFAIATLQGFSKAEIMHPNTIKNTKRRQNLEEWFDDFGIRPNEATNVNKSIEWAAWSLNKSFNSSYVKSYGIRGAIGYYNKGKHWREKPSDKPTNWDIDDTAIIPDFVKKVAQNVQSQEGQKDKISVPYIESVLWRQQLIEDAQKKFVSALPPK